MDILTLLSPSRIVCSPDVSSRKRAFEILAEMLTEDDAEIRKEVVFDSLIGREKLGSTALGNGVAIPRACLPVKEARCAMLIVEEGVKMDAPDKKPVQLFFAILAPSAEVAAYANLINELTIVLVRNNPLETICQLENPAAILDYLVTLFRQHRQGPARDNAPGNDFTHDLAA